MSIKSGRLLKKPQILITVILLLFPGILGIQMLGTDSDEESAGSAVDSSLAGKPYTVGRSDIVKTILLSGEMVAERSRDISCPRIRSGFSSTVTFMADEGSTAREGDRILEFDSSDLVSSKAEAERKLDEAELLIRKTTADLEAQRCDLANEVVQAEGRLKIAKLYAAIPQELLPSNDYQSYQVELERTQLALDKALEKLKNHDDSVPAQMGLVEVEKTQAELDLRKIESDLKLLQVNAPQNGIIVYGDNWRENRKVQVGDAVYPGMRIISLPDLSSMQAIGYIYDTELRYLSPGMSCDISLDAIPGRLWKGSIVSITSVAGRKGFASDHKVFKATIRLEEQDTGVMRPGMTTRIQVPVKMASNAISIPRNYLDQDSHGRFRVWKDGGTGGPSPQNVEVGAHGENLVEIISGVNTGEVLYPADPDAEVSR